MLKIILRFLYVQELVYCSNLLNNWDYLSKISIIKCQHENYFKWNRTVEEIIKSSAKSDPILQSYKCGNGEKPVKFTFKGKIQDFKLNGPGKLKIHTEDDRKNPRYEVHTLTENEYDPPTK